VLAAFGWQDAEGPQKLREVVVMELLRLDCIYEAQAAGAQVRRKHSSTCCEVEAAPTPHSSPPWPPNRVHGNAGRLRHIRLW
jgi:hypothetical protein